MQIIINIPNIISLSRIAMAPFALLAAYYGQERLFLLLFSLMLISDVLDGYIARKLHQCTMVGSRLDSIGDYVTYLSVPMATWWLWPEIIHTELIYITVALSLFVIPGVIARLKFGAMVSYHTWITKITAVVISIGLIVILFTKDDRLFHLSVYLLSLEALEHLLITMVLNKPRSNTPSLWHLLKKTKT